MFRDPARAAPRDLMPGAVLAPADGSVLTVGAGTFADGSPCVEMRLFLALTDVHVQRAPTDAVVTSVTGVTGGFGPAYVAEAGDRNMRVTLGLRAPEWSYEVVQVSGMLARRIVTWVAPGSRVRAGDRIGMIKLGSQVILRLPAAARPLVGPGQHVRAGLDVVALVPAGMDD
jgi:phosphatidylserine decarboxylase